MATLNLIYKLTSYLDLPRNSNPLRRPFDESVSIEGLAVSKPQSVVYEIPALSSVVVFDGTRTLTMDGTTQLMLSLTSLDSTRYRLSWTGTGTAPGFRTARLVVVASGDIVTVWNSNSTLSVTSSLGSVFGAVQVGDTVLVPGASTGDTTLFDPLNEGEWTVLAASAATILLVRPTNTLGAGASETVAISDNLQFQVYSAASVQVGDSVVLASLFAASSRHTYEVVAITARRMEFLSQLPLAEETLIPGANSVQVYSANKNLIHIETDQELAIQLNGDTTSNCQVSPFIPGDQSFLGFLTKTGPTFSMTLVNRSTAIANVLVLTTEA